MRCFWLEYTDMTWDGSFRYNSPISIWYDLTNADMRCSISCSLETGNLHRIPSKMLQNTETAPELIRNQLQGPNNNCAIMTQTKPNIVIYLDKMSRQFVSIPRINARQPINTRPNWPQTDLLYNLMGWYYKWGYNWHTHTMEACLCVFVKRSCDWSL